MANVNLTTAPPTRAASGLPIKITLASEELGDEEFAYVIIDFGGVGFLNAETVTINDLVFTARNPATGDASGLAFNEFLDTLTHGTDSPRTLYQALLDTPLVDDYTITVDTTGNYSVSLFAKRPGPAYNLTASLVTTGPATLLNVAANANLRSQNKANWSAYVELYTYEQATDRDYPIDPAAEPRATRVTRFELPATEANAYTFNLSAWLHSVVESTGRCVAYFVRYGEIYSTTANPYRRRYEAGRWPETGVAWAFDAAEDVLNYSDPREPRYLTNYRGVRPACLLPGGEGALLHLAAICDTAGGLTLGRTIEHTDGTDEVIDPLHWSVTAGGVYDVSEVGLAPVTDTFQTLLLRRVDDVDFGSIEDLRFEKPATDLPEWLRFRNRLGGLEAWGFATEEPAQARTLATFSPADGSTQVRRVDLAHSVRLTSGLLTREAFDFLRTELAASPQVDHFSTYSVNYVPVVVTDFDLTADVLTGEYSIALTITPRVPFTSLTR